MFHTALLVPAIGVFFASWATQPDRPPKLDFDKGTDYIAWFNEHVRAGKTQNALSRYGDLALEGGDGGNAKGPVPKLEGAAEEQFDEFGFKRWEATDYPALAAYVKQCSPYLDIMSQAVRIEHFWWPIPPETSRISAIKLPLLGRSRHICRALVAQSWIKRPNQANALLQANRIVLRHADHMQQSGIVIGSLFGLANRALVYESTLSAMREQVLRGDGILEAFRLLQRHDPAMPDWHSLVLSEWASVLDLVQYVCPGGRHDMKRWDSYFRPSDPNEKYEPLSPGLKEHFQSFNAPQLLEVVETHFGKLVRIVEGPPRLEKARSMRQLHQRVRKDHEMNPAIVFIADLSRAYELSVRTESYRRGTMLALAINVHHEKHGRWPESLRAIDEKLNLKGVSTFRVDPYTGKSFRYRIENGGPLLYTIGADGVDNGGQHDPKFGEKQPGDFVFWPYPDG